MELEESSIVFKPIYDTRPTLPEPPLVNLVAVADLHVPSAAGLEVKLDAFYVGLLKFEREGADAGHIIYKADNFRLCFDVLEPPIDREDIRPIGINVRSLQLLEKQLYKREIEFEKERGLFAGQLWFLLQDPAGNWLQIGESRPI